MSSLSRCSYRPTHSQRALRPVAILRLAACFAIALAFGVSHVYLRFSINKTNVQASHLQKQIGALNSDINSINGENGGQLTVPQLIKEAREDMHLIDSPPISVASRMSIPQEVEQRYAMVRSTQAVQDAEGDARGDQIIERAEWLQDWSERMGVATRAMARGTK